MQDFWVTVSRHHFSLRFKLNGKSHTVNVDNFKDTLKIYPKLAGQTLKESAPEEAIISFLRVLGHTGEIKFLSDVHINHMYQPWRSLAAIINKYTSAKEDKPVKMKQSATKSKGLTMLYEAALSEANQMKLATKRSKKEFHSSHASGSGDGVDIQSKVPDEKQQTQSGTNEGAGDKPEVLDSKVPDEKQQTQSGTNEGAGDKPEVLNVP
nr:hypothetical protein [Tanacetum cinerariifolium]